MTDYTKTYNTDFISKSQDFDMNKLVKSNYVDKNSNTFGNILDSANQYYSYKKTNDYSNYNQQSQLNDSVSKNSFRKNNTNISKNDYTKKDDIKSTKDNSTFRDTKQVD